MCRKLCLIFLFFGVWGSAAADSLPNIEQFSKFDRVLILSPHPDDEAIACAGIIQQALKRRAQVQVAYLTNGEHNELAFIVYRKIPPITRWDFEAMGQVRHEESVKAMKYLGLGEDKLTFLGYPDFNTFTIFTNYWQTSRPHWDLMTRISSVPYKNALSPGAPYVGESILKDIKTVLLKFRPNKVFVSHPADVNVDHKTLYLYLQVALADLKTALPRPRIYPYPVHAYGWPLPRNLHPLLALDPPSEQVNAGIAWWKYRLTPQQLKKKHRSILFYRSQTESSAFYLLSFVRKNELFGDYFDIELAPEKKRSASVQKKTEKLWDLACFIRSFLGLSGECLNAAVLERASMPKQTGPVNFSLEEEKLVIRIQKARASAKSRAAAWIYLFGYSYKTPFAMMPKVYIQTRYNKFRAYDGPRMLDIPDASADLSEEELTIRVPLTALGRPDFILASVRAYTGALPIYSSGFRRINLTLEASHDRAQAD